METDQDRGTAFSQVCVIYSAVLAATLALRITSLAVKFHCECRAKLCNLTEDYPGFLLLLDAGNGGQSQGDTVRLTCFCVFYSLEIHGGPPVPRRLPPEESECKLLI